MDLLSPDTTALFAFLEQNPQWVFISLLLIAFLESLAIAGVLIPGVALISVAAFVAGSGTLSISNTLAAAFIGAVLGDVLSFLLGRYFHQDIKGWGLFQRHPQWIGNGEVFFQRHGVKSVVIGRFIGPLRPIIPLVAGMFDMPARRFVGVNLISACGWAPLYTLPGYFAGTAIEMDYPPERLVLLGSIIAITLLILFYLIRSHFPSRRLTDDHTN